MHVAKNRAIVLIILIFGLMRCGPTFAQVGDVPVPPVRSTVDERGVDVTSGDVLMSDPQLSIGTSANGLVHRRYWPGGVSWRHDYMISAFADAANHVTVSIGSSSTGFTLAAGTYSSDQGDGAALTENSTSYTYTARDGTTIYLDKVIAQYNALYYNDITALGTVITPPTGLKTYLTYKNTSYEINVLDVTITIYGVRLQSVRNSAGFQLKYTYATNTFSETTEIDWLRITNVRAINNAVDYCDPAADSCSGFTQSWPSVSYSVSGSGSNSIEAVTDAASRVKRYTTNSAGQLIGIRRPSSGSDNVTYAYDGNGRVSSVAMAGVGTWTYGFSLSGTTLTGSVTTPTIPTPRTVVSNTTILQPTSISDENGQTTSYTYDGNGRLTRVTAPEGNYTTYNYDGRGNLTSTVATPKSGSGLGNITISAAYPSTCTNAATCNKPTTTTDAAGKITNYYYNTNGTPDYVQAPAPASGAARPETHYSYGTVQAWLKNSSGSVVLYPDAMTWLTATTSCITGAWPCSAANQRVTQLDYYGGPSATNISLYSTTLKSGSGTPTATTIYGYDPFGNVTSTTDPLGNVTTMTYAADRQLISVMSPSIDGSPTSRRRYMLLHYNSDGLVDSRSLATINPNGTGYTALQIQAIGYDGAGRKILELQQDPSVTYARTEYSYKGSGRLDCVAQRMNPATFGSAPFSACTLGTTGSYGPDRITNYVWEYAGALDRIRTGYGTASVRDEVRYTHTANGQLATMLDAKGNATSYTYDGHDRPLKTCYNASLSSCVSGSATDFVTLTYDSVGRLTNRGLRGHSPSITTGYGYDDLGRLKTITYPGGGFFDAPVTLTYDNVGQLLSATDTNGHSATYGYDALGRVTSQGDAISSRTMQYDANGRRTRLTWSDGRYVTYGYNGVGEMTSILESGSTSLAAFAYDDLGRRSSLTRGNGVVTTYGYDGASRLTSLVNDLAGTTSDQTLGMSYSPANQITTRTLSNDIYAWTGYYNVNRNYTTNGLNQYTASGAVVPTYDVKGNLYSAGSSSYNYSTKNELVQRNDTGVQFYHDPLGRLDSFINTPSPTKGFQYADGQIVTEIGDSPSFTMLRRYVYGPRADEPIVWYEGSDFSNKRYLTADERGSVVSVTNSAGNPIAINSYDEYGIPGTGNMGRFQFTGQAWIPELGMYSFKARVYSPTLGRFLQTDPAGYVDGPNWYNYAQSDPINRTDPSGLNDWGEEIGVITVVASLPTIYDYSSAFDAVFTPVPDLGSFDFSAVLGGGDSDATGTTGGTTPQKIRFSASHNYRVGPYFICAASQTCANAIRLTFPFYIVPNLGKAVSNGQISPVYGHFGFFVGHVLTLISKDGLSASNITLSDHLLRQGQVDISNREIDGSWYVGAHGYGSNINSGVGALNQFYGPAIFDAMLQSYVAAVRSQLHN